VISLTLKNVERIRRKLDPILYEEAMHILVQDVAQTMANEARTLANERAHDTGKYAQSFVAEVHGMEARVYSTAGIVAQVMESGRRPGARMPPSDALAGWASRHGFPATALYVLARAIGRRGIKAKWIMRDARARTLVKLPAFIETAKRRIAENWYGG